MSGYQVSWYDDEDGWQCSHVDLTDEQQLELNTLFSASRKDRRIENGQATPLELISFDSFRSWNSYLWGG